MKREKKKRRNVALVHHNDIKEFGLLMCVVYVAALLHPLCATVSDMNRCTGWTTTTNAIPTIGVGGNLQKSTVFYMYKQTYYKTILQKTYDRDNGLAN
jgi:hypothetical protein